MLKRRLFNTEHITDLYRRYLAPFQHIIYCGAAKTQCPHYVVRCEHLHIANGECVHRLCFLASALWLCFCRSCFTAIRFGCAALIIIRYSAVLLCDVPCFPGAVLMILREVPAEVTLRCCLWSVCKLRCRIVSACAVRLCLYAFGYALLVFVCSLL